MAKELKISEKTVITTSYAKTDNIIEDIRTIIQSARNLRNYRSFYRSFSEDEIWQTHLPNLTWSHYNALLRVIEMQKSIFLQQQNDRLQEAGGEDE